MCNVSTCFCRSWSRIGRTCFKKISSKVNKFTIHFDSWSNEQYISYDIFPSRLSNSRLPLPFQSLFNCSCLAGYEGRRCQDEIDYCSGAPCWHNATCTTHHGWLNHTCDCLLGKSDRSGTTKYFVPQCLVEYHSMYHGIHWPPVAPNNIHIAHSVKITRFCHFRLVSISTA